MQVQNLQEKRELVAVYNELCSTLLDVQVTLSQNKPQSMTAQDRNAAATRFQNSMQVPTCMCLCWHLLVIQTAHIKQCYFLCMIAHPFLSVAYVLFAVHET